MRIEGTEGHAMLAIDIRGEDSVETVLIYDSIWCAAPLGAALLCCNPGRSKTSTNLLLGLIRVEAIFLHNLELGRDDRLEIRLKHRTENIGRRAVLQLGSDLKSAVAFYLGVVQKMEWVLPTCARPAPGRWHMLMERARVRN